MNSYFQMMLKVWLSELKQCLGAGLLALSGVLIGIGFQAQFGWFRYEIAILFWVIGGLMFMLGSTSSIVSLVLSWREWHKPIV